MNPKPIFEKLLCTLTNQLTFESFSLARYVCRIFFFSADTPRMAENAIRGVCVCVCVCVWAMTHLYVFFSADIPRMAENAIRGVCVCVCVCGP